MTGSDSHDYYDDENAERWDQGLARGTFHFEFLDKAQREIQFPKCGWRHPLVLSRYTPTNILTKSSESWHHICIMIYTRYFYIRSQLLPLAEAFTTKIKMSVYNRDVCVCVWALLLACMCLWICVSGYVCERQLSSLEFFIFQRQVYNVFSSSHVTYTTATKSEVCG